VTRIAPSHYEAIFLIHALQNLASKSLELARIIVAELFYISCMLTIGTHTTHTVVANIVAPLSYRLLIFADIDSETRKNFYKPVGDVIGTLAQTFPELMSVIFSMVEQSFACVGSGTHYLVKKLPLQKLLPSEHDTALIQSWLLKPLVCGHCIWLCVYGCDA
jgi:hypothetical protein